MDNHVHLFVWTPDSQQLSDFMRTVEPQLARYINKVYARDSQAIKDRFKSRVVIGTIDHYAIIQFIYLNRYKVDKTRPDEDSGYIDAKKYPVDVTLTTAHRNRLFSRR